MLGVQISPTTDGEPSSTHWRLDANGNVLSVEDRFAAGEPQRITRTWDRRDRIASETDPHGRTLRYTYDPQGNRLTRIDEAVGETTTYTYDARHRNTSVSSPSGGTTTLDWYRDDRQRTVTRPGNVVSTTALDRAGRVEGITHAANGSPLVTLAYDYDLNGNRTSETLTHAGQPPVVSTYRHDRADRLQSMTVDGVTTTYTLDGAGNRTGERTAVEGAPATRDRNCTYDARDRIEGCTDAATGSVETYAWDATGRMTQETLGGLTRTHAWDSRDRLLRIEQAGGPTTTYAYDPEGLRIETAQGATGERVQYDAGHRHAEINGAGNVTRRYQATAPHRATSRGAWARIGAAAMTLFLGMTDAGAIPIARHYLHDAHGTPVAITTDQGAIAQRSAYDVWGNPTQVETLDTALDANPNRIGYTGYTLDLEGSRTTSGAAASANSPMGHARYYAKARYYGAGRGSFISVDPWDGDATQPLSYNKYLYGYSNPGIYIDPDGRIVFVPALIWAGKALVVHGARHLAVQGARVAATDAAVAHGGRVLLGLGAAALLANATYQIAQDQQAASRHDFLANPQSGLATAFPAMDSSRPWRTESVPPETPDHIETGVLPGSMADAGGAWSTTLPAADSSETGGLSTALPKADLLPPVMEARRASDVPAAPIASRENTAIRAAEGASGDPVAISPDLPRPQIDQRADDAAHKAARWADYQARGGQWTYDRWSNVYNQNMVRARAANEAAEAYRQQLGWSRREVTVDVEGVPRKLDMAEPALLRGAEHKTGYQTATQENLWEIQRDQILIEQGWQIHWQFDGRASKPLIRALDEAGIPHNL